MFLPLLSILRLITSFQPFFSFYFSYFVFPSHHHSLDISLPFLFLLLKAIFVLLFFDSFFNNLIYSSFSFVCFGFFVTSFCLIASLCFFLYFLFYSWRFFFPRLFLYLIPFILFFLFFDNFLFFLSLFLFFIWFPFFVLASVLIFFTSFCLCLSYFL